MSDRSLMRDVVNTELLINGGDQKVDDGFCPVCAVPQETKVTQGFFRAPKFPFLFAELV